jgi:superfamily II DNA or RNA helicase
MIKQDVVKLKIIDEVSVIVIGLKPSEYTALSESFAVKAKNFQFNPQYKAKRWDGKIRYFTQNGKTYINLLPEIIPVIKSLGYKIEVIDRRDQIKLNVPEIDNTYLQDFSWDDGTPITLGDHQVNAINALTKNHRGMIEGGTGAGKTLCCWVLHDLYYKHCGYKTLIIVPTVDLVYQTVLEFQMFSSDVGYWGDSKKKTDHPVVISTWQTLQNQEEFVSRFKYIIVDECHGGKNFASNLNKIMNQYAKNCPVKMGMTGTFPKHPSELRTLHCALGDIVYRIPAKELIDKGWLAEMNLSTIQLTEDFTKQYEEYTNKIEMVEVDENQVVKVPSYSEFLEALFPSFANERDFLAKSKRRNKFIGKLVAGQMRKSKRNNTAILVNTKAQGHLLESLIPNSKFIYGKDSSKVRKQMFDLFSTDNDVIMITTFGLAAVGLNIKRIFNIFMIDGGKSFERVIQTLGRGLRKAEDKDEINIFDISSNLKFSARHAKTRRKYYKEEGHKLEKMIKVNYYKP